MIKNLRFILYAALIAVVFLLVQAWQEEQTAKAPPPKTASPEQTDVLSQNTAVEYKLQKLREISSAQPPLSQPHQIVRVNTPLLSVSIDTMGGRIVRTELLKYPKKLHGKEPTVLLNEKPETFYTAQDGLMQWHQEKHEALQYRAPKKLYQLKAGQKSLTVNLEARTADGLNVVKTLTFKPDSYVIGAEMQVVNTSSKSWTGNYYMQLSQDSEPPKTKHFFGKMTSFVGLAVSSKEIPYHKLSFKKLRKEAISDNIQGGWMAMLQHYFLSAWIPNANEPYHYYSRFNANDICSAGMISQKVNLAPNASHTFESRFYTGPKITEALNKIAPNLGRTVDYSSFTIFSLLATLLFNIMNFIHKLVGNWGWSIILMTVLIRLLFYKLSASSYKSMAGMKKLQPKIKQLKERFGDDRQKMSQAMMELYRKEKISPLGGCLPMLVQIPVFLALYWVLLESVQLRQAPFMFWIHDLSVKDPYYILPILMGASMYLQQKLSPQMSADPNQARIMMFLPVFMTALFLQFPAGLVLYWFVNNLLSVAQQWYITKKYTENQKKSYKR